MSDCTETYREEINRRAATLIDEGDLDAITAVMTPTERTRYQADLCVICAGKTELSRDRARDEVRELLYAAARRAAAMRYQSEMHHRADQLALERYYRHMGACA